MTAEDKSNQAKMLTPFEYESAEKMGEFHIFNQKYYSDKTRTRHGTEHDVKSLIQTSKNLGFVTYVYNDLATGDIVSKLEKLSKAKFSDHYGIVCVILTHGGPNGLLATADYEIKTSDFQNALKDNPTLIGKPKLFFIQACRGSQESKEVKPLSRKVKTDAGPRPQDYGIASESDFLLHYSSPEDFASFRDPDNGTIFIQQLCENLNGRYKEWDLLRILTQVNHEVSVYSSKDSKQTSVISSSLRGPVYFCLGTNVTPSIQTVTGDEERTEQTEIQEEVTSHKPVRESEKKNI